MPRTRDVIVPNAVKGIEEVVIKRTNTKRGTVTSQKVVPVVLPTIQKGESSKMKKKDSELQDQSSKDNQSEMAIHTDAIDDTQAQLFGEHEYDFPEHVAEEHHPQVTVRIRVNLCGYAF
jgi:hypothetical protein